MSCLIPTNSQADTSFSHLVSAVGLKNGDNVDRALFSRLFFFLKITLSRNRPIYSDRLQLALDSFQTCFERRSTPLNTFVMSHIGFSFCLFVSLTLSQRKGIRLYKCAIYLNVFVF